MVYVRLAQQWTDGTGTSHPVGAMVDVDAGTLAEMEAGGVVETPGGGGGGTETWPGPTATGGGEGETWPGPTA